MESLLYWPGNHKLVVNAVCCIWWTCWCSLAPPLQWISPLNLPLGLHLMLFVSRSQQHEVSVKKSEYMLTKKHKQHLGIKKLQEALQGRRVSTF